MARGRELLTVAEIKAGKPPAKLHDRQGLYCEIVEAIGDDVAVLRRWLFRYTAPKSNKRRWMGLGSFDSVSLKRARDAADEARKLLRAGIDPIDKRKVEKITQAMEATQSRTFKEAALEYLDVKRGHRIPLSRQAVEMLTKLRKGDPHGKSTTRPRHEAPAAFRHDHAQGIGAHGPDRRNGARFPQHIPHVGRRMHIDPA